MATDTEKLINLDPTEIVIQDNVRYGLKPYRIERLAEQILADGGVNTPIEISRMKTEDGEVFVLTTGHYRHAAVSKLNTEQHAGLTLPCRVVQLENEAQRTLRQISENSERENMSPMDKAIAMQRLVSAGLSKMDIRKAFATPGGRKGLRIQPASNSYVNITMGYLELPKDIQKKLHDGIIGTGTIYELKKQPKEKWTEILDRVEAERIKAIDVADKEEEKFLKSQKDIIAKEEEVQKVTTEHAKVKEVTDSAAKIAAEKKAELNAAFQATLTDGIKKEDKKKAMDHFKSVQAEATSAAAAAAKAARELAALDKKKSTISERAEAARKRLEDARKLKQTAKATAPAATAPAKPVSAKDIKKAAAKVVADAKPVKLTSAEKDDVVKTLVLMGKPKTKAIGEAITACFAGSITDGQLLLAVARITGEEPMPTPVPTAKKK